MHLRFEPVSSGQCVSADCRLPTADCRLPTDDPIRPWRPVACVPRRFSACRKRCARCRKTAGRQGRRFVLVTTSYLMGGSTCLVPLNVLALCGLQVGTLRRSASRTRQTASRSAPVAGSKRELRRTQIDVTSSFDGLREAGRFAKAAFDRGRSEMTRLAWPGRI
jgi:hypothetical protein